MILGLLVVAKEETADGLGRRYEERRDESRERE